MKVEVYSLILFAIMSSINGKRSLKKGKNKNFESISAITLTLTFLRYRLGNSSNSFRVV